MCTAVFDKNNCLFGRTLDLEYSYNETVTVTPRGYYFVPRAKAPFKTNYAIIGMATVEDGYPLYYDAVNEKGLAMAGLNFPKSACYFEAKNGALNLAPFEIIPYILGQCESLNDAMQYLERLNVRDISFSEKFPSTPLHWIAADKNRAAVIESVESGLKIYENKPCVMTNEPPFPYHMTRLEDFAGLHATGREGAYSRGLSAYGLPGDFSSVSRFVRASFLLKNSATEGSAPSQFFKILDNVSVPRGAVRLENGKNVITHYASCMDMDSGIYYYKTYSNSRICGVRLSQKEADSIICYPLEKEEDILFAE